MIGEDIGMGYHEDHGRYPAYRTKKGNFNWRCLDCGEVRFFAYVERMACIHNPQWKLTKNGKHWYHSCPICRVRVFRPIVDGAL